MQTFVLEVKEVFSLSIFSRKVKCSLWERDEEMAVMGKCKELERKRKFSSLHNSAEERKRGEVAAEY